MHTHTCYHIEIRMLKQIQRNAFNQKNALLDIFIL